jgi:hypothetical protein
MMTVLTMRDFSLPGELDERRMEKHDCAKDIARTMATTIKAKETESRRLGLISDDPSPGKGKDRAKVQNPEPYVGKGKNRAKIQNPEVSTREDDAGVTVGCSSLSMVVSPTVSRPTSPTLPSGDTGSVPSHRGGRKISAKSKEVSHSQRVPPIS